MADFKDLSIPNIRRVCALTEYASVAYGYHRTPKTFSLSDAPGGGATTCDRLARGTISNIEDKTIRRCKPKESHRAPRDDKLFDHFNI